MEQGVNESGSPERRGARLSRDRVLEGALDLADEIGVTSLTMRRLAQELGVKPMTIYHYVPSKDEILDGIVDLVFAQIELPPQDMDWVAAMKVRCRSAREVLADHPWATPLMETRHSPGPATLTHHDAMLACLRSSGMSLALTAHAYAVIDAYVYGFALQEAALPSHDDDTDLAQLAEGIAAAMPQDRYPALLEFTHGHVLQPGYRFADSFEVGLDLILAGVSSMAAVEAEQRGR